MKTRNGFVSNSSSSSFIVHHKRWINKLDPDKRKEVLLSKEVIQKLVDYGFKKTWVSHPSAIVNSDFWSEKSKYWKVANKYDDENYGYCVTCNEWEVIQWLIKNDIGFIASGHYGHVTYLFHSGDKYLMVFQNYGLAIETYSYDATWEEITGEYGFQADSCKPFERISIKEVLEDKM